MAKTSYLLSLNRNCIEMGSFRSNIGVLFSSVLVVNRHEGLYSEETNSKVLTISSTLPCLTDSGLIPESLVESGGILVSFRFHSGKSETSLSPFSHDISLFCCNIIDLVYHFINAQLQYNIFKSLNLMFSSLSINMFKSLN